MADRERRGGARAPDGVPRPSSLPFGRGPNRNDMAELPGSPGSPAQPLNQPQVQQGQVGPIREMLGSIPIDRALGSGGLFDETTAPDEPVTAGASMGPGPGPESLIPAPDRLNEQLEAEELRYAYPLILRLATMPRATTATKILAQRVRAAMSIAPEQMPLIEHEGSLSEGDEPGEPLGQPLPIPEGGRAAASPGAPQQGSAVQQPAQPTGQSALPNAAPADQS